MVSATALRTAYAFCPAGTAAIGGGGLSSNGSALTASVPVPLNGAPATGWAARHNANTNITAYAICAV